MGLTGAAISNSIIYILMIVLLYGYLSRNRYKMLHPNAWHFINKDAFKNWGEYIKFGFPTAAMR